MKTNPFDEAIRRKLEAVNPPFQEKNWTQFQRFMGVQGFPPSLWQTPARWLQPALTAAALAGVLLLSIWQYRSQQVLVANVQTLTKTVERLERVQLRLQQTATVRTATPARIDTVYITRQISGQLATPAATYPRRADGLPPRAEPTPALAVTIPDRAESELRTQPRTQPDQYSEQTAISSRAERQRTRPGNAPEERVQSATDRIVQIRTRQADREAESVRATDNQTTDLEIKPTRPDGDTRYTTLMTGPDAPARNAISGNAPVNNLPNALADVQPLTLLPLPDGSNALAESWQRHLRRVRYRSPNAPTAVAAAPATPASKSVPLPLQWRVGPGGDLGTAQSGAGVYGEVLIGDHWTVGTGLGQVSWVGDTYLTEQQFQVKTKRDFRREYPVGDPPLPGPGRVRDVLDISRTGRALVVPVQLGYRLALGKHYAIAPFVGLNLSINPRETITYAIERQIGREEYRQNLSVDRPLNQYSNWMLGFGLERQWGRFAGQLSPVALVPLESNDGGLNTASVGVRGRFFYCF